MLTRGRSLSELAKTPHIRDALEFSRLAAKRWRYYRRSGLAITSLAGLRKSVRREPQSEFGMMLLAKPTWRATAPVLGFGCPPFLVQSSHRGFSRRPSTRPGQRARERSRRWHGRALPARRVGRRIPHSLHLGRSHREFRGVLRARIGNRLSKPLLHRRRGNGALPQRTAQRAPTNACKTANAIGLY